MQSYMLIQSDQLPEFLSMIILPINCLASVQANNQSYWKPSQDVIWTINYTLLYIFVGSPIITRQLEVPRKTKFLSLSIKWWPNIINHWLCLMNEQLQLINLLFARSRNSIRTQWNHSTDKRWYQHDTGSSIDPFRSRNSKSTFVTQSNPWDRKKSNLILEKSSVLSVNHDGISRTIRTSSFK